MITVEAVNEPINAVKIPSTPIIDTVTGTLAREWLYFFNELGTVVDQAIAANLTEMTKSILESADTAALSLFAPHPHPIPPADVLDAVYVQNYGDYGVNELSSTIDITAAYSITKLQEMVVALRNTADNDRTNTSTSVAQLNAKFEELEAWQLLTTN